MPAKKWRERIARAKAQGSVVHVGNLVLFGLIGSWLLVLVDGPGRSQILIHRIQDAYGNAFRRPWTDGLSLWVASLPYVFASAFKIGTIAREGFHWLDWRRKAASAAASLTCLLALGWFYWRVQSAYPGGKFAVTAGGWMIFGFFVFSTVFDTAAAIYIRRRWGSRTRNEMLL